MKDMKKMEIPEMDIVEFNNSDVITTSTPMTGSSKNTVSSYGAIVGGIGSLNIGGGFGKGLQ